MEAASGKLKKMFLVVLAVMMIQPVTLGKTLEEKSKYVTSLVWEKAGYNPRVLAEMDGKALVLFQKNQELSYSYYIEMIDLETGKNLWDGITNDLGGYVKQKFFSPDWFFLKDSGLLYMKSYYYNTKLTCFDFKTGTKVWQCPKDFDWPLPRCIENGLAYGFAFTKTNTNDLSYIISYDLVSGNEVSKKQMPYEYMHQYVVFGKINEDLYYRYTYHGSVFSINVNDLSIKKILVDDSLSDPSIDASKIVNGKIIAIKSEFTDECRHLFKIVCIDTTKNKFIWSYNCWETFVISGNNVIFISYEKDCQVKKNYNISFVDIDTGKIVKQVFGNFNVNTILNCNDEYVAAFTDMYYKKHSLIITDKNGNVLLSEEYNYVKTFWGEDVLLLADKYVMLPCYDDSNRDNYNTVTLQCHEIIEYLSSELKLETILETSNQKLLSMYRNFTFQAKIDIDGKIADLSLVDMTTGKDIWPDNNTLLEKVLAGRSLDGLEYAFNNNEMFFSLFESDKKKALACFDILTGKLLWKSEKLKDYQPPTLYPYVSSFNGKEADVYQLDKRYGWTIKHYYLKNQTKPFSIVGINEIAMVLFDGQYSMFYYKNGSRGWISKDVLPKVANPLNSLLISNVFVSPVAEGNLVKLVGKDVFTGKVLWSKTIDRAYSFEKDTVVVTSKNEIILMDAKTGKDISSKAFPAELATGYNIKDIKIQNSLVWLIMEKPNKGSFVYLFDKNLELLSQKDFEGKFIGKVFTGLGRIAMTLENDAKTTLESVVLRLARAKKV